MTYSAEFTINLGNYENVKLTASGNDEDMLRGAINRLILKGPEFGDSHASLKAAVLYGRDQALKAVVDTPQVETDRVVTVDDTLDADAMDLIKRELGATVIETTKHEPEDAPQQPWKRSVTAAQAKPWQPDRPAPEAPSKAPSTASLLDDF